VETPDTQTVRSAYFGVAVAVVAVSFSAILIRYAEGDYGADFLSIAAGRMVLSVALLTPFALTVGRSELFGLARRDALLMVGIGAVLATHFSLWIASLELTSIASSVVLVTSHPVLVALVAHFGFKERLSTINAVGITAGLLGVVVLTRGDAGEGTETLLGDLLAFLGGVAAGVYILAGRRTRQRVSLVVYAFLVYASCAMFLLIFVMVSMFVVPGADPKLLTLPAPVWGLFLLMALGPSILGHTVYNWALKHVPASVVSVSLLGEPVGSSILAFLIFAETPPELAIVGGAVILSGIVLASWRTGARAKEPPPEHPPD
jgi:drug/metabolite transporter (DMT)-like permease